MKNDNGWEDWGKHVLSEMGRLADGQQEQTKALSDLRVEVIEKRSELRKDMEEKCATIDTRVTKNETKVNQHSWFLRALVAAVIGVALTGGSILGVGSCNQRPSERVIISAPASEASQPVKRPMPRRTR